MLIVFAGRPGTGKSALSRRVADGLGATYLRVDTIEAAIRTAGFAIDDNPVGYSVALRVAADQLRAGRAVVADAVNDVLAARDGWVRLADECAVAVRFVEVICSDADEHRRRIAERGAEMPGHHVPSWDEVWGRPWAPWTQPRLTIDNQGDLDRHVSRVIADIRS